MEEQGERGREREKGRNDGGWVDAAANTERIVADEKNRSWEMG